MSKGSIISEISITPKVHRDNSVGAIQTTGATFQKNNVKRSVPVVTLSINDDVKFLENMKQGFKRTTSCNKYGSEITTQAKNNNLDYLIDPTCRNINRLFVLSFKNSDDDVTRNSFDECNVPLVEVKNFNSLVYNKPSFDHPVKNKQEAYKTFIKMSRNNDYATGNLLDYLCHEKYYKRIGIDLSRQKNMIIPQLINFVRKLEEDNGATMFFLSLKSSEKLF